MKCAFVWLAGIVIVCAFLAVAGVLSFFTVQEQTADSLCTAEVTRWKTSGWIQMTPDLQPLVLTLSAAEDPDFLAHDFKFHSTNSLVEIFKFFKGAPARAGFRGFAAHLCLEEKLAHARSLNRSLLEFALANELSGHSPDESIELILNRASFIRPITNETARGFEAASQMYFNKTLKALSLSERAELSALVASPSYFDPKTEPDHLKHRRDRIIDMLAEAGKISASESSEAKANPL